ncbi:MAG TPA: penicillin-binding protein 2 [Plasticicumulans sp.]|uniref:penicillin-binding protein 2 n=1 Tax=Plasticicumulans sp. TaxID=2307179 RepID=UPI002C358808|nr:penicillin-binding protein 2 [Plasticicumulans sp.]MBS0600155.1 penicillin-binding protein 2 [Pseudomonadota bacterium]HMV38836.1 penicillin-binding protein 2 [Plasticicumulans sp.]HMW29843.1 penicillin-binding protein 2 [Plasticicumulans sp.]HMW41093.1 penicillin-binding protein 2 [Plasticicumulans sp.]HMZ10037.1 penicillin-binding protein 2 [Plasticicumulans sp.]
MSRPLRDTRAARKLFAGRALVAGVLVFLLFSVIAARLAWLQIVNHEHFATLSDQNRIRLVPVPPTRGQIFDRKGVLLAGNLASFHLEITPEQVGSHAQMEALLEQLKTLIELSDSEINRFRRLLRRSPRYNGVPLRFNLTEDEMARVAINQFRLPGVDIRNDLTRTYPLGTHMAHVVGYVGRIDEQELARLDPAEYSGSSHIGKIGVEKSYEDVLRGKVGYQQVETNAQGRVIRVLESTPPTAGRNVYLTIDSRVQRVAELALSEANFNGAIVAIDPRNGELIAMASNPSYDPNPFVNGIDAKSYKALNTSPDRPLYNRALRGMYPPGSTIKPFMGLAGLAYNAVDRYSSIFCGGYFQLPGQDHKFRDWRRGGHGRTDLDRAITESCDVYFYDLALELGIDRIGAFLGQFGFGKPTGIDLRNEKSGLLPSQDWKRRTYNQAWFPGDTVSVGIGQGYLLVTPLQLASATATLAMGGRRFQPRIVHALEDPALRRITELPAVALPSVAAPDRRIFEWVTAFMTHVVHSERGTAFRAVGKFSAYRIAGKTGTAQVFTVGQNERYDASRLKDELLDHALFMAFAPADAPRIAVAVIAENGGHGGSVAAPLAKKVMDAYLLPTNAAGAPAGASPPP